MGMDKVDVTEAELAVLREVWERPGATIRVLAERLYPRGGAAGYGTVQKLLERLEAKRFVARDRGEVVHRFSASVDRDELIGRRLKAVADALCGGSLAPLLTHLVEQTGPLSEAERAELRGLVERLSRERRGRSKPGRRA
jgi:predicted transcriptional regulator